MCCRNFSLINFIFHLIELLDEKNRIYKKQSKKWSNWNIHHIGHTRAVKSSLNVFCHCLHFLWSFPYILILYSHSFRSSVILFATFFDCFLLFCFTYKQNISYGCSWTDKSYQLSYYVHLCTYFYIIYCTKTTLLKILIGCLTSCRLLRLRKFHIWDSVFSTN